MWEGSLSTKTKNESSSITSFSNPNTHKTFWRAKNPKKMTTGLDTSGHFLVVLGTNKY
jgi:hypothetical protein